MNPPLRLNLTVKKPLLRVEIWSDNCYSHGRHHADENVDDVAKHQKAKLVLIYLLVRLPPVEKLGRTKPRRGTLESND